MSRLLPNVGRVSYNGFDFPETFEATVTSVPRRDSAGRAVKYVTHTITISCQIFPEDAPHSVAGDPVDENLENIRCKLMKSGGSFLFYDQGFGRDFVVNDTTPYLSELDIASRRSFKLDVLYGPHVTNLVWRPVGSNRAVQIIWTVEVTTAECCEDIGMARALSLLEHSYTMTWDLNEEGAMIRTVQGRFEVPGFRQGAEAGVIGGFGSGAVPAHTALELWDACYNNVPILPGFHREHRHTLSADQRVVEFTIIDKEIPSDNAFFPYMVKMNLVHQTNLRFPNIYKIQNTISGTILIAPKTPRHWAWLAFVKVAQQRINRCRLIPYRSTMHNGQDRQSFPYISDFSIEEQIYGRSFTFSVSWWFLAALSDLFQGNGLFTPVSSGSPTDPPPSWVVWSNSLAEVASSATGLSGLGGGTGSEAGYRIVTICDTAVFEPRNQPPEKSQAIDPNYFADQQELPPVEQSYLHYSLEIESDQQTNTVQHSKIQSTSPSEAQPGAPGADDATGYQLNALNESTVGDAHYTQVRGPSQTRIVVSGSAVRVGYDIPIPKVASVGGVVPTVVSSKAKQKVVARYFGVPVFGAAWSIVLDLPTTPAGDLIKTTVTDGSPEKHV
jgi:hypothetical protein